MRDKSGTFLLWHPGYIALRTQLRTLGPDKDTWDTMADEVPCELWQPLSIALTRGHRDVWNNNKTISSKHFRHRVVSWQRHEFWIGFIQRLVAGGRIRRNERRTEEMDEAGKRLDRASDKDSPETRQCFFQTQQTYNVTFENWNKCDVQKKRKRRKGF